MAHLAVCSLMEVLGEMQRIAIRLMLSSYVCVSVCMYVCMPRFWTPGERFEIETLFFFKLRGMTPGITCKSLTQSDYEFQCGEQNGGCDIL